MSDKMPLLFSRAEAAAYLHLETDATLDWLEQTFKLPSHKAGKQRVYWKRDLDVVAYEMVGEPVPAELRRQKGLRLMERSA